jgi:Protein of unknown function (DUF2721)
MRLSRSIDQTRVLEELHAKSNGVEHRRYLAALAMLERRIKHSNRATSLSVASALAVCLVVVLLFQDGASTGNIYVVLTLTFLIHPKGLNPEGLNPEGLNHAKFTDYLATVRTRVRTY